MYAFSYLVLAFVAGAAFGAVVMIVWATDFTKKRWSDNPLTQQEKRVIRTLAQEATGREFIWERDNKLALWK